MDGITNSLISASTAQTQAQTANAVQVKALDASLEVAQESVLSLLEHLGGNIDTAA